MFEHGRVFENRDVLPYISTTTNAINLKNSGNIETAYAHTSVNFILFKLDTQRQEKEIKGKFCDLW